MKKSKWMKAGVFVAGVTVLLSCSRAIETVSGGEVVLQPSAASLAASWSSKHMESANMLIGKYGEPDVVSDEALIWVNKGAFVRTVLWRKAVSHNFPIPHTDFLTQTVMYTVPADKLDELWKFDGSLWLQRTRGQMSAQCDLEAHNLIALNLGHDVATGRRSVSNARAEYAKLAMAYKNGDRSSPYTSGLIFPTQPNAEDPDKPHKM